MMLEVKNLIVLVEQKEVLQGLSLTIDQGETHAIMGPNGGGKSSLAFTLAGHPRYQIKSGEIIFEGNNVSKLAPEERAKRGIFLAFQYPVEVPGVNVANFLRVAYQTLKKIKITPGEFLKLVKEKLKSLKIEENFLERYLNEGFSGGEKKKMEILQLALFEPKLAVLDETDSGLDIDALKTVSEGIKKIKTLNPKMAILLITHYQRILKYLTPTFVHVLEQGRIVKSGSARLAEELEEKGYAAVKSS